MPETKNKKARQPQYHNVLDKPPATVAGMHAGDIRLEFARRLQAKLVELVWNQSELCRRVTERHPDVNLTRDKVSKYVRGASIPEPPTLRAIADTLHMDPRDLLPAGTPSAGKRNPPFEITQADEGLVWLRVNTTVTWDVAMQVMALVKPGG